MRLKLREGNSLPRNLQQVHPGLCAFFVCLFASWRNGLGRPSLMISKMPLWWTYVLLQKGKYCLPTNLIVRVRNDVSGRYRLQNVLDLSHVWPSPTVSFLPTPTPQPQRCYRLHYLCFLFLSLPQRSSLSEREAWFVLVVSPLDSYTLAASSSGFSSQWLSISCESSLRTRRIQ